MFKRLFMLGVLASLITGHAVTQSRAQGVRRYQPATPTLSPYLNLLGREGVLPNYYSLVRPQQQQEQFNQQSMAFRRQQQVTNQLLERQLAQPSGIIPTGSAGGFLTEGRRGAGFQNTSHFFQPPNFNRNVRR